MHLIKNLSGFQAAVQNKAHSERLIAALAKIGLIPLIPGKATDD